MSSFERLGDRRTGKFLTLFYIRKCYFFSWLFENHPVLHKIWLNFEMRLPSLKFLEPHSDRLQSSFYRWSLLTHLETENVYTQKKKKLKEMYFYFNVNKMFNVNLNFLYGEFLNKMFNSKPSFPDHFPWPNPSKYLWTHPAPLSMGVSKQEHWSGVPFPPLEDLPNPEIKPMTPWLLHCRWFFTTALPGKMVPMNVTLFG